MLRSLIIALLIISAFSKPGSQKKSAVLKVLDIDLSKNNLQVLIELKNLEPTKAVMVIVEQTPQLEFSPFEINATDQNASTLCSFKYANNLCVFEHSSNHANVVLRCLKQKCKFSISFSQRGIIYPKNNLDFKQKLSVPGQIFKIDKRKFNTIIDIYAERDEHKVIADELTIFSNVHAFLLRQVEELQANNAIFGLKPIVKDTDQYIFIESKSKKTEHFSVKFKSHNGQLRDRINIIDFIQNYGRHSNNTYTYIGGTNKNLQINARIFSPPDSKDIPLTLKVKGKKDDKGQQQDIRTLKFEPIDFQQNGFIDFTFGISKKVHQPFKFLFLQILLGEVEDKSIFFEIEVKDTDSFEISIFDHIFFGSEAGEELRFIVVPQIKLQLEDGDKDIQIITNANQNYFTTVQSCSLHKGCSIDIRTKDACQACSFKFNLKDQDTKNHIIYYEVTNDTIEGKVDFQEELFFKYAMNGMAVTKVVVNSLNVVIYAVFDSYERCKIPKASCHQFAINMQNPLVITNKDNQPGQLILGVAGLQKSSFKVRFINQNNGLSVKLGEKFSYLMNDQEKKVVLKLELPSEFKQQLSFNLISPIHSTKLTVIDDKNPSDPFSSSDGYITLKNNQIKGDIFSIQIEKINLYYDEFLHFTLIVTTDMSYLRLETSISHYEKFAPKSTKKFIIQYEPSEINALNIYTQNLEKVKGSMVLQISQVKQIKEGDVNKPVFNQTIVRDSQFILLEGLSQCDDINCELQISIKNTADYFLQQAITLLSQDSIISLDDSIWSVFQINDLTKKSHFYFVPRHQNNSIRILFNTDDLTLFINYRIFNTKHSINPVDWPFDHQATDVAGHISYSQEIYIPQNDSQIAACWPNCVILINLNQAYQERENKAVEQTIIKSFRILATNSIVQLLEDMKMQFTLRAQEERDFFIMLTRDVDFQSLTFFTYYSIGRAKITASLFSDNRDYPLDRVVFEDLQTHIDKKIILDTIDLHRLNFNNTLIKINVKAQTNLKMTMEYTSHSKDVIRLAMDQTIACTLPQGNKIMYSFLPERDFILKLYRSSGFPIFKLFYCKQKDFVECFTKQEKQYNAQLAQFLSIELSVKPSQQITVNEQANSTGIQVFVEKTYEISGQQCDQCIYFIWIYCFEGNLGLSLNLRSKFSEIELKQKQSFMETSYPGSYNRYLINIVHDEKAIVGIKVVDGVGQVVITEGKEKIINETLDSGMEFKEFSIENDDNKFPVDEEKEIKLKQQASFGGIRRANQYSVFKHIHVTVTAVGDKPVDFVITYSIGKSSQYLQVGIVVQKLLIGQPISYFYRNRNQKQHAYLTLNAQPLDQQKMSNDSLISVKFYYYQDAGNRQKREIFKPQLPPKRNQNYLGSSFSMIYQLPAKYELYEIQIQSSYNVKVTASINHQQLVYLPLGFEYLIKLHSDQSLNIVVDKPDTTHLEVNVKKCDQSAPRLQYTNDARQFKRGIFQAEVQISNNNFKEYLVTKEQSSTIHLKFISPSDSQSLFTISAEGRSSDYVNKGSVNYKAGDKGNVNYKMIQANTIELEFKPVVCGKTECPEINYFLVIADNIDTLYGELNCAGTYFVPQAKNLLDKPNAKIVEIGSKYYDPKKKEYRYLLELNKTQDFIGIKGVVSTTRQEIQYIPIKVHDIWGEFSKISFGLVAMICLALALVLTIVIVVSTKLARRGYKPISSEE